MRKQSFALLLLFLFTLTACANLDLPDPQSRLMVANKIASEAGFAYNLYEGETVGRALPLAYWHKGAVKSDEAVIYIAGDGYAWANRSRPSDNPTPLSHLTLKLAALDPSPQIFVLARPGQYIGSLDKGMRHDLWTGRRFAPEIIKVYQAMLDDMTQQYEVSQFHLIGYSGGAAVAALIAADRDDILSFRSVAGNLDNDEFVSYHGVSEMSQSLNPLLAAKDLSHIPQIHFIGAQDKTVPFSVTQSWKKQSKDKACVRLYTLDEAGHIDGWEEAWPDMVVKKASCNLDSLSARPID